jgi:tetratricopeptide (TPR) repeat protein
MARRLPDEDLEKDPLIENFEKAQSFYEENKQTITGSIIALVVVVVAVLGWNYYSEQQEQKAQALLGYAERYMANGEYEKALQGDATSFTVGFDQIINNYSMTDAANLATYYAAVSEYNLGNIEAAIDYMNQYEVPDGFLGVGPISFHAVLLETMERNQEAAEKYLEASDWDLNESTTPYNLVQAAELYMMENNYTEAQKLVDRILNEYPNSNMATKAEHLKGRLLAAN